MTPPLGEILPPTKIPELMQIRAEIQTKLTLLHHFMLEMPVYPVTRGNRGSVLNEVPGRASGVVQYPGGESSPGTIKEVKAWLEHKIIGIGTTGTEGSTTLSTRIELLTQTLVTNTKSGVTYLKGNEKVRASITPSFTNPSPLVVLEDIPDGESSFHDLKRQLSTANDALETIELIAAAPRPNPYNPTGRLAVSSMVSLSELPGYDSGLDTEIIPELTQAEI